MHKRLMMALLLFALPVVAQNVATSTTKDESLLIGPGDLLHIAVYDTPQFEQHSRLDDAGDAPLLFIGTIRLVGDTPAQAAVAIQNRMIADGLMRHPQVSIVIEEFATQDVSIVGQVARPGNFPLRTARSINEILSMAGGLTSLADRHITVRRHDPNAPAVTYFVPNNPANNSSADVKVFPGDTILVPKVNLVYVLGDVARPGGYPMLSNDTPATLLQTLAVAGSANRTAVLTGTKLIRKSQGTYTIVPVDIAAIERGKSPDITLETDDVLFVPFSYTKNFLLNGAALATSVSSAAVWLP